MTTIEHPYAGHQARSRADTILGRILTAVAAMAPKSRRWLVRFGNRARQIILHTAGLAAISYAAWQVAQPLGWLTIGASLLVLEWLSTPERP